MASEKGPAALKQGHAWTRNKATSVRSPRVSLGVIEYAQKLRIEKWWHRACSFESSETGKTPGPREREKVMNHKNTSHARSKVRLAVKKETLKDLSTKQPILGGLKSISVQR